MTPSHLNTSRPLQHFKPPLLPAWMIAALPLIGFAALHYADSLLVMILCCGFGAVQYRTWRRHQRAHFIEKYQIPLYVLNDVRREYALTPEQLPLIERGFKDFCLIHLNHPYTLHNMPSKAVDALWHGLILDTLNYEKFCRRAFGHMLHHRPSVDMQRLSNSTQQNALKATWHGACQLENMRPQAAQVLPLLFAIDQHLAWPQGLHYSLDQLQQLLSVRDANSAGDGGGGCGGTSIDLSDSGSSGGDSSGDSSCGGGCGGD